MNLPFDFDHVALGEFGGLPPTTTTFDNARVVILPIPLDRTTSYVPGTRNGPHEILVASSHMELWDEETETDVHTVGIFTMPEMDFPFASMDDVVKAIRRVATEIVSRDKFLLALGGEHSGHRHAGARRAVMVRGARAAPPRHRSADGGRLRHRGAGADGGQRRAQFPVREADLQDPLVPFWIGREDASLGGLLQVLQL